MAFTAFLARKPALAYLGFVECYANGRDFATRVDDTQLAFTLFLEEGHRNRPAVEPRSRASLQLTAAMIAETAFQAVRSSPTMQLRPAQPLAVYIALAPFIGADEAGRFVNRKLLDASSRSAAAA